ncbi:MAG: hypothetical protein OEM02_13030 [Desulfobulbaceae bacterium]|nr:hypothetical protein [Desulfobulbaceae bacterium]
MSKQSTPLLKDYQIMLREAAACKPGKPPLYATISFGENISQVFPYLNRILKGRGIIEDPPTLVIHKDEHQIVLKAHSITISNLTEQHKPSTLCNGYTKLLTQLGIAEIPSHLSAPPINLLRFWIYFHCFRKPTAKNAGKQHVWPLQCNFSKGFTHPIIVQSYPLLLAPSYKPCAQNSKWSQAPHLQAVAPARIDGL